MNWFNRKSEQQPETPAAPDTHSMPTRGLHNIARPKLVDHLTWSNYLGRRFNKPGMKVLEIGSRVVTGANFRSTFSQADYTGFDFYAGPNVDIAGDAHRLSTYFPAAGQFDLIFSTAVFEHLHMPWIVAEEIAKMLKVGGMVFIETHFAFAAHERPWNFFQFSEMGLRALFNKGLGFDVLDMGMSNPIVGFFGDEADEYLRRQTVPDLYCHSEILAVKTRAPASFDWHQVGIDDVVDGTRYPAPKEVHAKPVEPHHGILGGESRTKSPRSW